MGISAAVFQAQLLDLVDELAIGRTLSGLDIPAGSPYIAGKIKTY